MASSPSWVSTQASNTARPPWNQARPPSDLKSLHRKAASAGIPSCPWLPPQARHSPGREVFPRQGCLFHEGVRGPTPINTELFPTRGMWDGGHPPVRKRQRFRASPSRHTEPDTSLVNLVLSGKLAPPGSRQGSRPQERRKLVLESLWKRRQDAL